MNWLRKIYPLWLREKLYFHLIVRARLSLEETSSFDLEFAPVNLRAILDTDYGHRQIAWIGFYELELSRRISALAGKGGLMVDVGANAGYFSCIWASSGSPNQVYAFEPSPRNLSLLRKNISSLDNPQRVKIFDYALGKENGMLNFDVGPEDQSGWGGLAQARTARTIPVSVRRLDDFIDSETNVSVLKIDTEGADTWVLYGAEKALRQKRIRHIFFEGNLQRMRQLGIQAPEAERYLKDLGYSVRAFGADEFYATPE